MKKVGWYIAGVLVGAAVVFMALTYPRYKREMRAARERLLAGSQVIETAAGPIEYAAVGDGYPVLIVHGAGGGYDQGLIVSQVWVGDDFRQIAISRFGYLRTPAPSDASPAVQADAFRDLLDALNIRRVAIMGISAGGPSTLQFALRHPDRLSALIMMSAVSHTAEPESLLQKIVFNTIFRSDFIYWLITTYFQSNLLSVFGVSSEVQARLTLAEKDWISEFLQSMHPIGLRKAGIYNDREHSVHDYPLERIAAPTLVIHAVDDGLIPFSHGQYSDQNIPGARFITLQSGGHMLVGQHEKVKLEVTKFFKQHIPAESQK